MNKKLSRIAAIALSAAMVTSAFAMSTSASFAATVSASIDTAKVSLSTSGAYTVENDATAYNSTSITSKKPYITVAGHKYAATGTAWDGAWSSSNTSLATIDNTGAVTVKNSNISNGQEVTFTRTLKVEVAAAEVDGHQKIAKQTAEVPVKVVARIYKSGASYILPGNLTDGAYVSSATTLSENEGTPVAVYTIGDATSAAGLTGSATFTAATASYTYVSSNSAIALKKAGAASTDGDAVLAQPAGNVKTGTTTISVKDSDGKTLTDINTATVTVDNTYKVNATDAGGAFTVEKKYGNGTKTYLTSTYDTNQTDNKYDVTGKNLELTDNDTTLELGQGMSVGTITDASGSYNAKVDITGAHTGDITVGGAVAVVTGDAAATEATTSTGNITTNGTVTVTGSTVKSTSLDSYTAVKVGNISAAGDITATVAENQISDTQYEAEGAVAIGNITETGSGTVALTAGAHVNNMTLGKLSGQKGPYDDCPYGAKLKVVGTAFNLGDLPYFGQVSIGSAGKTTNVTAGTINTGAVSAATATDCGVTSTSTLAVAADAKLTASKITTAVVDSASAGTIIVPANSLEIQSAEANPTATNATLVVTNATNGSVLFKSNAQAQNLFKIPGITSVESKGDSATGIYTYSVKALQAQGIKANATSVDVGTAPVTVSVTNVPNVALPDGVSIAWMADKDSVKLTPSADGHSCAIQATGYTANNINGSNNVNVTAYLVKDNAVYTSDDTPMSAATIAVTLTNAAPAAPVLTTKVQNLGDTEAKAVTADTVVKMTQSTYATVDFSADKAGITAADLKYGTGSDKVAQTGTYDAWNGTAGKYYIYANGKVGDKVGVYANGQKIFQVEIVDRPFTSDTTVDFAMKAGSKYQFKIIPNADTTIKDFTFNTANDAALSTWGFKKNADGTVTATVKANKAGKYGVYCDINGVKYKVFAVTVK